MVWNVPKVPPVAEKPVHPREEVSVKLSCRAPDIPGVYPFWWRMSANNEGRHDLFGDWFQKLIVVTRTPQKSARQPIPQYSVRLWQTEDGLPQNSVQAAIQTRDGYIWVGTQNGLARFDGVRFTVFHPRNVPEMKSGFIFSLAEASDGSLWIGTYNGGLLKIKNGVFSRFTEADGLASDAVRAVLTSSDGTVWVGTTNGLSHFRDGTFSTLTTRDGLAHNVVRGLAQDQKGDIWAATADGVNRITAGSVSLGLRQHNGLVSSIARTMTTDRSGNVWVGTTGGLTRFQQVKTNIVLSSFSRDDADSNITAIHEDKNGNIWAGTYGGLSRIAGGRWITETKPDGSAFDLVSCIFEDREGNIWLGLKEGLARLQTRAFSNYTMQEGLIHNNVMSVCEDKTGALWLGTWGGGLNRLSKQKITPFLGSRDIASQNLVLSVHVDARGCTWAGLDYNGGLFRIENETMTHFGIREGLKDTAVRVIQSDRAGNLWLGTSQSLLRFADGKFTRFTKQEGLAGEMVRAIFEDSNGALWIGTAEGLSRYENGSFRNFSTSAGLPHPAVIAIFEDKEKNLWFGTGGGLAQLARDENQILKFRTYTMRDGLFNDEVLEILEDDFGYFWMSCRYGVFRIPRKDFDEFDAGKIKTLSCQSFGHRDGMVSIDCNGIAKPAGWKGRDGRLWFPTTKGLTVVDPRIDLSANAAVPPIVIEAVWADKKRILETGISSQASSSPVRKEKAKTNTPSKTLTISPGPGGVGSPLYRVEFYRAGRKSIPIQTGRL